MHRLILSAMVLLAAGLSGCQSTYYKAMEGVFGQHKRDILVDRVVDARNDQEEAKEQFASALEQFTALVDTPNSELRKVYDRLNDELERSEDKANDVRERIDSVERVSEDLFREWETELDSYTNDEYRTASRRTLDDTRAHYASMIRAMRRPEQKMDAVLATFRDHVLFLKHNLNAQVIASLQGEVNTLELNTAALIRDMEMAIAEADEFIKSMEGA